MYAIRSYYEGSARSIGGFHLYQALASCRQHLLGYGGHAFAAGLTIAEAEIDAFASYNFV